MPKVDRYERIEVEIYLALLKEARRVDVQDEKACDELLLRLEAEWRHGNITEEMIRVMTRIVCSR